MRLSGGTPMLRLARPVCTSMAHRADHATKVDENAIAGPLDGASMVRGDRGINQIAAQRAQPRQRSLLVGPGEPAVADNIGDQDRRDFPGLAHGACCRRPSRPFQTVPATALGGERKTAKAISLMGVGMAASPCCTDDIRGDRECRPGIR